MALPLTRDGVDPSNCSLLLIYRPRKDERLSWPIWLTYIGRFTHISGYPSAVGRVQDRESSPVKDRRSIAAPRNQPSSIRHIKLRLAPHCRALPPGEFNGTMPDLLHDLL